MADECMGNPCSVCGERITGANWFCRHCKLCICLARALETHELEQMQKDVDAIKQKVGVNQTVTIWGGLQMASQAAIQKEVEKLKEATGAKPKRELHVTLLRS